MTTVTIRKTGRAYRLTAVGHATGSGPTTGNPAVCAAVSGIVYALGGYLRNLERAGDVELAVFRLEPGDAALEAYSIGPAADRARDPFGMAAVGLMQLAAQFPEQVRVDAA